MRRSLLSTFLALMAFHAVTVAFGGRPRPADGWYFDFNEARTVARQTGQPLLVVFR